MKRIIENEEKKYFIHNKTRIIITEHFNENGKPLEEIIEEAIKRNGNTEKISGCIEKIS